MSPGVSRRFDALPMDALAATGLLIAAWLLYRPDAAPPFDYVDFPENVRVLRSVDGFVARYGALVRVYVDHGRWSPITLASVAGQWSVFGWWTTGWLATRYTIMALVVLLAYLLSRRLGLNVIGAFAASAALVVSPAAVPGWTRLSSAEPMAMIFLLLACHLAIGRHGSASRIAFAALLLGLMWTKEIITVAFAFPVILALASDQNGHLHAPRWTRAHGAWLTPAAAVLIVGSIPILWAWLSARDGAFASRYASGGVSVNDIVGGSLASWLPFAPVPSASARSLLAVVGAFFVMVAAGSREALKPAETREHRRVILALSLSIPVLGAVVYAPWPYYLLLYALPFALAGSLLPGQAVSSLLNANPLGRLIGSCCLTMVLTFGLAQAATEAARTRALHTVVAETVTRVAVMRDIDSVLVEVAPDQFDSTGNFGPRFKTYAWMLGLDWPAVRDIRCGEPVAPTSRILRLRLNLMCQPDPAAHPEIAALHRRFDWPDPRPRADSVTVTFPGRSP